MQGGDPASWSGSEDDGVPGAEQAGDGQHQGDTGGAGRVAAGRFRARALRAPDPYLGPSATAIFLTTFGVFAYGMYQVGQGNKVRRAFSCPAYYINKLIFGRGSLLEIGGSVL